jgi:hypothetical protein
MKLLQQQQNIENHFQDEKCPFESELAIKSHSDDVKCYLFIDLMFAKTINYGSIA